MANPYTTITANAGIMNFTSGSDSYTNALGTFSSGKSFWSFCTDVGVNLFTGSGDEGNGWDYIPSGFAGQDGVSPTWTTGGIQDAAYIYNKLIDPFTGPNQTKTWGSLTFDPLNNGNEFAAIQVAIWEVLLDSAHSLAGGRFKLNTTGDINTYAAQIVAQLDADKANNTFTTYTSTWLRPINDNGTEGGSQGLLFQKVPDTGWTLMLLGLGMVGLALANQQLRKA